MQAKNAVICDYSVPRNNIGNLLVFLLAIMWTQKYLRAYFCIHSMISKCAWEIIVFFILCHGLWLQRQNILKHKKLFIAWPKVAILSKSKTLFCKIENYTFERSVLDCKVYCEPEKYDILTLCRRKSKLNSIQKWKPKQMTSRLSMI